MELIEKYLFDKQPMTLKKARLVNGLTIDEVSGVLGILPNELMRHEEFPEEVNPLMAMRLANVYGMTIDDISFMNV